MPGSIASGTICIIAIIIIIIIIIIIVFPLACFYVLVFVSSCVPLHAVCICMCVCVCVCVWKCIASGGDLVDKFCFVAKNLLYEIKLLWALFLF